MTQQSLRHGCGGELQPVQVIIARTVGQFLFEFQNAPGRRCSLCGTEIIERDVALALETFERESMAKVVCQYAEVEYAGSAFTSNMPIITYGSSVGTADVVPVNA